MGLKRRTDYLLSELSRAESFSLLAYVAPAALGMAGGDRSRSLFESAWMDRFQVTDAVAFPSGRSSLTALLQAAGVALGDEVIATGYTCAAVAEGILAAGAKPVWVDIERRSLAMDPDMLPRAITARSRVVVIQHTLGIPAPADRLVDIARAHHLKVIEDCCHALGSRDSNGDPLGHAGDGAFWSFEVSKTISTGWGGIAQDNTGELGPGLRAARLPQGHIGRVAAARRLLHAGIAGLVLAPGLIGTLGYLLPVLTRLGVIGDSSAYTSPDGSSARSYGAAIGDRHWSVLGRQLARLDANMEGRRRSSTRYARVLSSHGIEFPEAWSADGVALIRFPLPVIDPDRMTEHFWRWGIPVGRWFDQAISPLPARPAEINYQPGQCPVSKEIAAHMANLPLHQRMSGSDLQDACDALDSFLLAYPEERDFISREFDRASVVRV